MSFDECNDLHNFVFIYTVFYCSHFKDVCYVYAGDHLKGLPISTWERPFQCHRVFSQFQCLVPILPFLVIFVALLHFPIIALIWAEAPLYHINVLLNHTAFSILLSNCETELLSHFKIHDFWNGNPSWFARFEANFERDIKYNSLFQIPFYFKWENNSCVPFTSSSGNGVWHFPILHHS